MRVAKAGVVGAGTMGAAIAEVLAFNGIEVVLKDVDRATVDRGLGRVRSIVDELVRFQEGRAPKEIERISELTGELNDAQRARVTSKLAPKFTRARGDEVVGRVRGVTEYDAFRDVDLVVEAVFERDDVKRPVLEALDAVLPDYAVIGSNTSSLSITRLARGLKRVRETLVTHFFNPPYTLPLVEVAGGVDTREDVVSDTIDFLQGLKNHRYPLVPIRVKESPAFVVNRLLAPVLGEACAALETGLASSRDIDAAMKAGAGMPMGPFELADLVVEAVFERDDVKRPVLEALDAVLPDYAVIGSNTSSLSITRLARGLKHVRETLVTHFFNPPYTLPLVEVAGGVDTREDVVSDAVDFLQGLKNHRYPLVPIRVKESPAFVVNRLLAPVLGEACAALETGLASSRDIDAAMKAGAGMPMGPFELADLVGLDVSLEVAETLYREFGDPKYRPSILLRRLVDSGHLGRKTGQGFYEYPSA